MTTLDSRVCVTLMTALVLCCIAAPLRAAAREAHVLVLNGVDSYLPTTLATDSAIRATLASESDQRVIYFSETLDAQRFPIETLEPHLLPLFAKKYGATRIDVVVAVSEPALEFFKRHGERLWPGARLVFQAYPFEEVEASTLPAGTTAVINFVDLSGTIDLAQRMQPDARRVVVISGSSEFDQRAEGEARKVLAAREGRIAVEFLSGLPLPEILARVAAVPPDSIVICLTQFRDRDGRPYTPREVVRAVSKSSRAPVYAPIETFVGFGSVAGSVGSNSEIGRLVGEQVRSALADASPDRARTLLQVPSRCVADAHELKRWSLDEARLPVGCEIRFGDMPVWRQYGWQITLTLAFIAAQTALIVGLLYQRRRRRLAEDAEQSHRLALARASRLAVAGELTGAIAHEINQPLGAIMTNVDVGDLMLDSGRDRRDELRAIFGEIRRDDQRASDVIQRLRDLLSKHEVERKPFDLNQVVDELASIMRAEAKRRGITLDVRRAPEAVVMMGDPIQIQQVLVNLVLNAMDAVADEPEARREVVVSVARGEHGAVLAVRDRGRGIAPEHRDKIFESFFSTKSNGMGVGLSITRTIVEAHGGRIRAQSRPDGDGTVFEVELPYASSTATALEVV